MMPLKSLWSRFISDPNPKAPEKDEQSIVCDGLLGELDYQIRELDLEQKDLEIQTRKKETGVDYSWLISVPKKAYEIPQLERLELEAICMKVKPVECTQVLTLFRDAVLNHPKVCDLPKIMKACINQVLERRPKEETLAEWVVKKGANLGSLRFRPQIRVSPGNAVEDPEINTCKVENHIMGNNSCFVGNTLHLNSFHGNNDIDTLPV